MKHRVDVVELCEPTARHNTMIRLFELGALGVALGVLSQRKVTRAIAELL